MKKKKTIIVIFLIVLLCLIVVGIGLFNYLKDPNKLNSTEKRYLADNSATVQNINILNNVNIFGNAGEGLFYDFVDDFSNEYGLQTNTVAYNLGESTNAISFGADNVVNQNEKVFYIDHYVLLGKEYDYMSSIKNISSKKIGVLANNLSYVTEYLGSHDNLTISSYQNDEELFKAFDSQEEIQFIIVPLNLYLDKILSNNYYINYHFSDMHYYYKFNIGEGNVLGSILSKYYNVWSEDNLNEYYNDHLFNLFVNSLNISLTEVDAMKGITYNYGFINNSPYEILTGGNYGGIIAQYLKEFTDFSDTELKFTKYKNIKKFNKAINDNKINLYFAYFNLNNNFSDIHSSIGLNYSVLVNKKNSLVVRSLNSLGNEEVYVEKNTNLHTYLSTRYKLNLKTYDNLSDLKKLVKKNKIIVIDSNIFDTYQNSVFGNYNERLSFEVDSDYTFKIKTNETFTKLFEKFINYKDPAETIYKGIYNHDKTLESGTLTGTIAKYFMYVLIVVVAVFLYVYKTAKRVKISKKIKKEDKLKYIDQLTSLKNRNYLSENLENWSKNTIYPQAVIVIDLNNLQNINDTLGYEQGDIQIKAAANVLVKTQLDNSDIIRTDGNEFVIYLVGYQTKQITSYIHKLNKEFKKLPYEYGASIGYSTIEDEIKSVEDAINEAVEDVKKQKEVKKEVN